MIEAIRQGLKADGFEVSISKLCRWFGVARRSVYYKASRATPKVDPAFSEPIKALIEEEPSFGYPDPPVVDSARAAAEAILHHVPHANRSQIKDLRRQTAKFRGSDTKVLRAIGQILRGKISGGGERELNQFLEYISGTPPDDDADTSDPELTLASIIAQAPRALRNMADYERRAISKRGRALPRLTLAKIEAELRQARARVMPYMCVNSNPMSDLPLPAPTTSPKWL